MAVLGGQLEWLGHLGHLMWAVWPKGTASGRQANSFVVSGYSAPYSSSLGTLECTCEDSLMASLSGFLLVAFPPQLK